MAAPWPSRPRRERETQLLSAAERVAVSALAKEKKVLLEVAASVRIQQKGRKGKQSQEQEPPAK